jgi:acetyltransferase-like isoleucine patch superfamily enzyme
MASGTDDASRIDDTARIVDSTVGDAEIREFVTVHDSEIGDGCLILERVSIKKSHLDGDIDVNAGTYVENAVVAAGATVTEDIGARKLVLGSPPNQQVFDPDEWLVD